MDKVTRKCPKCGEHKPRDGFGSRPYCPPCFAAYNRERRAAKRPKLQCAHCGEDFVRKSGKQITCSAECGKARTRARRGTFDRIEAPCEWCNETFLKPRATSRHCSAACKEAARHQVRRVDPVYKAGRATYGRRYHEANRERLVAQGKKWRGENRERHAELNRRWRENNKYSSPSWRRRNPAKHAAKERRRLARIREATPYPIRHEDVIAKIAYWAGSCWVCGVPYQAVDHVKPLAKGGLNIVANLRPICTSHNSKKRDRWLGPHRLADLFD